MVKKSVNIVQLMSPLHGEEKVRESLKERYDFFNKNFEVNYYRYEDINEGWGKEKEGLTIVWIMTGGTEGKFRNIYPFLPKPVVLLAESINNSLAASLEILSYVREYEKEKGYILYGEEKEILNEIYNLIKVSNTLSSLQVANIGNIGGPSEWLISSIVDYEGVRNQWGINVVDIPIEEFYEILEKTEASYDGYFAKSAQVIEPSSEDILNAQRVYIALKSLIEKYNLTALTLKCFDLLRKYKITGCLALSRLIDEGVIAGCEGDLPATFTMYLAYLLTGETPFMANPSAIDLEKNTIILAHCTVPTKIVKNYVLRSHFESGMSVGIRGEFEKGPVTILKFGGEDLSKISYASGMILDNPTSEFRCRTQIEVRLNAHLKKFISTPLGNHQVIIRGDHSALIEKLISFKGITVIKS